MSSINHLADMLRSKRQTLRELHSDLRGAERVIRMSEAGILPGFDRSSVADPERLRAKIAGIEAEAAALEAEIAGINSEAAAKEAEADRQRAVEAAQAREALTDARRALDVALAKRLAAAADSKVSTADYAALYDETLGLEAALAQADMHAEEFE